MKKISNKFNQRALTLISFLVTFAGILIVLKLGKVGRTFSSFNPCPTVPSVAVDDRKEFQFLNMVLNNTTVPLVLEIN